MDEIKKLNDSQLRWHIDQFAFLMYSITDAINVLYEELDEDKQFQYDTWENLMYQCKSELYNRTGEIYD